MLDYYYYTISKWKKLVDSDAFLVGEDSDDATDASHSMNFLVPSQQVATWAFRGGLETTVDVLHEGIQLVTIQSIDSLLHLGRFDWK